MSNGRNDAALVRLVAELHEPAARLSGEMWPDGRQWGVERVQEMLARAQLRAWLIDADEVDVSVMSVQCPLGEGRALLACARPPAPTPSAGAFVVARSLPFGSRRYLLVGRPLVVVGTAASRLNALIASLRAPRGEFWHVHGAVIARSALSLLSEMDAVAAGSRTA